MSTRKRRTFSRMMETSIQETEAAPGHVGPIAHNMTERLALIKDRHRRRHPNSDAYAANVVGHLVKTDGMTDLT